MELPQQVSVPPDKTGVNFKMIPLGITEFQVNQVLGHQKDGENNFVAGKATALRVFLSVPITPDPALQKIVVNHDGTFVTDLFPKEQQGKTDVLEFLCPTMFNCNFWQEGNYTFEIRINGVSQTESYEFVEKKDIRILALPVITRLNGQVLDPPADTWKTAGEFLNIVYPVAFSNVSWDQGPTVMALNFDMNNPESKLFLLLLLSSYQPKNCDTPSHPPCYDHILGFIPDICQGNDCQTGWTHPWLKTASVVMTTASVDQIVAHEIGHNYGLGDEYGKGEQYPNMCGGSNVILIPHHVNIVEEMATLIVINYLGVKHLKQFRIQYMEQDQELSV